MRRFRHDDPASTRPRLAGAVVFLIAFVLRLGIGFISPPPAGLYDNEMHSVARNLAAHGTFGNPYGCPTGPTAHVAPGYAACLALAYRYARHPEAVIVIATSAVASMTYGLLPWLAVSLGLSFSVGFAAGLFGAVLPFLPGMEVRGAWEAAWVAWLFVIALGLTGRYWRRPSLTSAIGAGFAWGIAFLFGPALAPPFAVIMIWFFLKARPHRRATLALVAAALLTTSPWIVRNYERFGRLFWIRSDLGLELEISNSPGASPYVLDNLKPAGSFNLHPGRPKACAVLQRMGELPYMDERLRGAIRWIRSNPKSFLRLTGLRFWYYWCSPFSSLYRRILALLLGVLGIIGAVLAFRRSPGGLAGPVLLATLAAFPALYYLVQADPRYRAPMQPVVLVAAACALMPVRRRA